MVDEETVGYQQSILWFELFVDYLVDLIYVLVTVVTYLSKVLANYCGSLLQSILLLLISFSETLISIFDFSFSDFQIKLLQVFCCILAIHILAICVGWKVYSERITQRFLKPSQYEISSEQLKTAVSELKLPAEHTPRW